MRRKLKRLEEDVEDARKDWKEAIYSAFEGDSNTHLDQLWGDYKRALRHLKEEERR